MSGVDLFPTTFTVAPCAIVVGATITKLGVYKWAIWTGWTLATLGKSTRAILTDLQMVQVGGAVACSNRGHSPDSLMEI